jgi:hypothetical protein
LAAGKPDESLAEAGFSGWDLRGGIAHGLQQSRGEAADFIGIYPWLERIHQPW